MEFSEKLQTLRKQNNLTQEELAERLFVSRTAISKWESGRGYPNIESLKAIAKMFSVSIDELLDGEQLLSLADEEEKGRRAFLYDLVFGLLDFGSLLLLFLPLFRQKSDGLPQAVSLLELDAISVYLKVFCCLLIGCSVLVGILTLALQQRNLAPWNKHKRLISAALNLLCLLIFVVSLHPYAAMYSLLFMVIKAFLLLKWR